MSRYPRVMRHTAVRAEELPVETTISRSLLSQIRSTLRYYQEEGGDGGRQARRMLEQLNREKK